MCNNTPLTDVVWLKCQAGSEKHRLNKRLNSRKRIKMTWFHSITQSTSLFGEAATCPFLCPWREREGVGERGLEGPVPQGGDLASRPLLVLLPAGSGTHQYLPSCTLFFCSPLFRPLLPLCLSLGSCPLAFKCSQNLNPLSEVRDQTHLLRDTSWVLNPLSHNSNSHVCCF